MPRDPSDPCPLWPGSPENLTQNAASHVYDGFADASSFEKAAGRVFKFYESYIRKLALCPDVAIEMMPRLTPRASGKAGLTLSSSLSAVSLGSWRQLLRTWRMRQVLRKKLYLSHNSIRCSGNDKHPLQCRCSGQLSFSMQPYTLTLFTMPRPFTTTTDHNALLRLLLVCLGGFPLEVCSVRFPLKLWRTRKQ